MWERKRKKCLTSHCHNRENFSYRATSNILAVNVSRRQGKLLLFEIRRLKMHKDVATFCRVERAHFMRFMKVKVKVVARVGRNRGDLMAFCHGNHHAPTVDQFLWNGNM